MAPSRIATGATRDTWPEIRASALAALVVLRDYIRVNQVAPSIEAWAKLLGKKKATAQRAVEYLAPRNLIVEVEGARYAKWVPSERGIGYIRREDRRRLKEARKH